jgi:hypothetical protein
MKPGARRGIGLGVACAAAASTLAGTAAGAKTPNPCTLVPIGTLGSTVGLTSPGKLSTRPDGRVKQTLCTFTKGATMLEIYVALHQPSGGSGGPPGMVISRPAGIGGGTFATDSNPKFAFANAFFTKGKLDAGVWDNGKVPAAKVLALARIVYKDLP